MNGTLLIEHSSRVDRIGSLPLTILEKLEGMHQTAHLLYLSPLSFAAGKTKI